MGTLAERIRKECPALWLEEQVPMSGMTTLKLGGPADLLAQPASETELAVLLRLAAEENCPVTVVGNGSNLLVLDGGIRGLVIRLGKRMANLRQNGDELVAEGGATLGSISQMAAAAGLTGLAFASGIPGTVGGAVMMNAGAYGGEMTQVVSLVEGISPDGTSFCYPGEEMRFGYRKSRLKAGKEIVTRVTMRLNKGDPEEILREMKELNRRRAEKQPLTEPSAGSTFKRPEGNFAAALIEQCGLKGRSVGGAAVSEKHAGFLVNRGGTANDFLQLMQLVTQVVAEKTGIRLEPEVRILGEQ